MNTENRIIAVAGPTASGKTALAAELASRLGGEVISNDSMQIYRGMEIGTAAPTEEEKRGVVHHLFGICDPWEDFSCADYGLVAKKTADEIISRGRIPVFCGGTGLYLDAVMTIGDYSESVKDETLRERLCREAEELGPQALHEKLSIVDPVAAEAIHPNNIRRVIRAIEIYETTGITKTEWDKRSKEKKPPYDAAVIVLEFNDRNLLYERIDKRVDEMISHGLEAEAKVLFDKGLLEGKYPAAQAIGYKEFEGCFKGAETIDEAVAAIKQNTRRYAKRQITWFRRYKDAIVIHPDLDGSMRTTEDICREAQEKLKEFIV